MAAGVYIITNNVTGRRYVGSAVDLPRRKRQHWHDLRRGRHTNPKLQNSWVKYGEEVFEFSTLLVCAPANCVLYEQIAMDAIKPEMNINPMAASRLGAIASPEARAKQSAAKLGRPGPWAGKKLTAEHRAKLSAARMGKKPANTGIPCSEEQKAKIRAKLTKPKRRPARRVHRLVVDASSGAMFRSLIDAAAFVGMTGKALGNRLRGATPNDTSMRYADGDLR